jgi:hypothetical protein
MLWLRIWRARLRLWLLYAWRRGSLSRRVPSRPEPDARAELPPVDTGGAYRAGFGSQFGDPSESHTSPHSEGSNCTMASAGMALDHHTGGRLRKRGGDMRHRQSDNDSGTDLYDAAEAWAEYGESLSIRSGAGWSAVVDALEDGRGVILQGTGGVASCGDYTGGHAIYVAPESSGSRWLKGDPECSGYEWTEASALKGFATRLSSGVYFAVTKAQSSTPPAPAPAPCPPCPDPAPLIDAAAVNATEAERDRSVGEWVAYLQAPKVRGGIWDASTWADDCPAPDDGIWSVALGFPDPVAAARHALATPPLWDSEAWRSLLWA